MKPIKFNLRFDKGPGPVSPGFIEAETMAGDSFQVGLWCENEDGTWFLQIDCSDIYQAGWNAGNKSGNDFPNRG